MKLALLAVLALSSVACAASTSSDTSAAAAASSEEHIVGGTVAQAGAWPGTVAVYIGGSQSCGGSLVAPQWVMTAGHCVEVNAANGGIDRIVAKKVKLSASGGESIKVAKAFRHPQYDSNTMDNDIALLQLASPSTETPVTILPAADVAASLVTDATLTVVGWGTTSENGWNTSDALRQVDVPFITNDKCKTFTNYTTLVDDQFCAGYAVAGKDSCQGDSGGPIFVKAGGTTYQAGLVSWGEGCARANQPGVYTRVSNYIDWMKTTSNGAVDFTPPASAE